jgi:actin-related protein
MKKTLILDNGAYEIKAGFAGSNPTYSLLLDRLIIVEYRTALLVQKEIVESTSAINFAIVKIMAL